MLKNQNYTFNLLKLGKIKFHRTNYIEIFFKWKGHFCCDLINLYEYNLIISYSSKYACHLAKVERIYTNLVILSQFYKYTVRKTLLPVTYKL